jgi:acyl-[acyl-carrier-protein]-phospholipid O-acyltransferase/long-chain-fatty-acid--[acyl-carrier-protein] ligase
MAVNALQKGEVSARYVPASALGLAVGLLWLWWAPWLCRAGGGRLDRAVHGNARAYAILAALGVIAFSGGMFIVPLYAIIQVHSPEGECSRMIAANNIVNAALTVAAVLVVTALLALGIDVPDLIGVLGLATLAVALVSIWLLPETLFKDVIRLTLRALYRVEVKGSKTCRARAEGGGGGQPPVVPRRRAAGRLSARQAHLCGAHGHRPKLVDQPFLKLFKPSRSIPPTPWRPRRWSRRCARAIAW